MRVQSIIRELRGEKIDIIEYSDDPVVFATHALSPAKVSRIVVIDALEKHMEVIVDDSQLSLAIGKKGQNVRLAAKLLGWKIDIKSEEEKRQEVESQMAALVAPGAPVSVLLDYGMSDAVSEKLQQAGVGTIERLGTMTPEQLEAIPGIDPASVEFIQASVVAYYSQFEDPGTEGAEPAEGGGPDEGGEPAEGAEPGEGSEPAEPGEPIEPIAGSSPASLPEEILLSGPAAEDGEDGEPVEPVESGEPPAGGDAAQAARPMAEGLVAEPSEPAPEALEVVTGEGPETVEQFGTIEDAGSPHNHAEGAGAESVPKNSSDE
jgi:N utilization substance protein A